MKTFILTSIFLFSFFCLVNAEQSANYREINEIISQLEILHNAGIKIKKLNTVEVSELRGCVDKYGHLRNQAKELRAKVQNLPVYKYRFELMVAADSAFTCVYCGGTGRGCEDIQNSIKIVRGYLDEDQAVESNHK
ncbi:hypothetical protein [Pseudomonas sp.]|uniref:hypothetical protein n=1 Tax=Pseudomonas sp. TaxID=306 RepID=UPI003D09E9DF